MGGSLPLQFRYEPGDMSETWKRWEGAVVREFPLRKYLGGSAHGSAQSAVFLTSLRSAAGDLVDAAIKLMVAGATDAETQLLWWKLACEIEHPNVIRVFDVGRYEVEGTKLLYVVQEYAEENLSQILPERALTADEAREMLPSILSGLEYLHGKGFAHGRIQPSNILAIGNQVKLSSDGAVVLGEKSRRRAMADAYDAPEALSAAASKAGDVWQLGMTLVEALTQQLPARERGRAPEIPQSMAEPFRGIAKGCLQADPAKRWTIAQISGGLEPESTRVEAAAPALALVHSAKKNVSEAQRDAAPVVVASGRRAAWYHWVGAAVVLAVVVFLIARPKQQGVTTPAPQAQSANAPSASSTAAPSAESTPSVAGSGAAAGVGESPDGVVHQVVPEVSPGARRSIHGKIVVRVRVRVDSAGDVEVVKVEGGRASKYFRRIAMDAARDWKFVPAQESGSREWKLEFAFSRGKTEVSAARGKG
jgi:TonB family protein